MRKILLCGPEGSKGPQSRAYDRVIHRIKEEPLVSEAISLSLARKRPERGERAVTAMTSSFVR